MPGCQEERAMPGRKNSRAKAQRHHVGLIQRLEGICLEARSEIRSCRDGWGPQHTGFWLSGWVRSLRLLPGVLGEPWELGRGRCSVGALCSWD